jgi:hypothetical protein
MSKLAAVLVSTLVFFILAVSWLPSSFDPILNWFGPVLGPSFQVFLALIFMLFGSPLIYSIAFTTWAITGIVVGLFARGLRSAIGAASLVYTFVYALLGIVFGAVFLQLNNSGLLHGNGNAIPSPPPGTNTATLLNIPVFKQFAPLFLSSVSGLSSGSSPLSSFNIGSLLSTIIPAIIGGFVILVVFSVISGFAMGRITKMLRPSKQKWQPANETAAKEEKPKPPESPPSQQEPVPISVGAAAITIIAILLIAVGFAALGNVSYASSSSPSFYTESAISLVNPDGSATNYYNYLSNSFSISSMNSGSMGPDVIAAVVASQEGNLGFLPQSIVNQFSRFTTLVPPTAVIMLYSGTCSSTSSEASSGSASLASGFGVKDLSLLVSFAESGSNLGLTNVQNTCVYIYQSSESLSTMATTFGNNVISAFYNSGLISVFQDGLSSGFLIPGSTPTSVNSSAIYAGFIEPQFLSNIPVIGQMVSGSATSQGVLGILGGVAQQDGAFHSSSNQHTASFAQLMDYSNPISFASISSFSLAGLGVPLASNNNSSKTNSIPSLSGYNYTMVTTNPTLLEQVLGTGQNITSASAGQSISSSILSASFSKVLPAYLSFTKSFKANSNGTVTVTLTVLNKDTDSLSNLLMDDSAFTNAYSSSLSVVSGNPVSSASNLAPSTSVAYSYNVKLSGIGTYSSAGNGSAAVLSYDLNGTQFELNSAPAYYNMTAPTSIGAIGTLANSIGGVLDKAMNISSGATLVYVILAALFAAAGFMEYRSFTKWRKG